MIDTVIIFTMVSVIFELMMLGMFVPPRQRLQLLGSKQGQGMFHLALLVVMLYVHWGTLGGTMTAFLSFVVSVPALYIAQLIWGKTYIAEIPGKLNQDGSPATHRRFRRGIINYNKAEVL